MRRTLSALLIAAATSIVAPHVSAQIPPRSGCADCHYADPKAPRPDHLESWDRSPHGRNAVGCETCHGGNPRTFEGFLAHQAILGRRTPGVP